LRKHPNLVDFSGFDLGNLEPIFPDLGEIKTFESDSTFERDGGTWRGHQLEVSNNFLNHGLNESSTTHSSLHFQVEHPKENFVLISPPVNPQLRSPIQGANISCTPATLSIRGKVILKNISAV